MARWASGDVMLDVKTIHEAIRSPADALDELDLHAIASILAPEFPHLSIHELASHVAEVAVAAGWRQLVWLPPEE